MSKDSRKKGEGNDVQCNHDAINLVGLTDDEIRISLQFMDRVFQRDLKGYPLVGGGYG